MKYILSLWGMFFTCLSYAQEAPAIKYPIQLPSNNIFGYDQYIIEAKVVSLHVYEYTLKKKGEPDKTKTFEVRPNTVESFLKNFRLYFRAISNDSIPEIKYAFRQASGDSLNREGSNLFYRFQAGERTASILDPAPDAGRLCYNQQVDIENYQDSKLMLYHNSTRKRIKQFERKFKPLQYIVDDRYLDRKVAQKPAGYPLLARRAATDMDWKRRIVMYLADSLSKTDSIKRRLNEINDMLKVVGSSRDFFKQDVEDTLAILDKMRTDYAEVISEAKANPEMRNNNVLRSLNISIYSRDKVKLVQLSNTADSLKTILITDTLRIRHAIDTAVRTKSQWTVQQPALISRIEFLNQFIRLVNRARAVQEQFQALSKISNDRQEYLTKMEAEYNRRQGDANNFNLEINATASLLADAKMRKMDYYDTLKMVYDQTPKNYHLLRRVNGERCKTWMNRIDQHFKDSVSITLTTDLTRISNKRKVIQRDLDRQKEFSKLVDPNLAEVDTKLKINQEQYDSIRHAIDRLSLQYRNEVTKLKTNPSVRSLYSVETLMPEAARYKMSVYNDIALDIDTMEIATTLESVSKESRIRNDSTNKSRLEKLLAEKKDGLNNARKTVNGIITLVAALNVARDLTSINNTEFETLSGFKLYYDSVKLANTTMIASLSDSADFMCLQITDLKNRIPKSKFEITQMDIEFNEGSIENMLVEGKIIRGKGCEPASDSLLKFNNRYPIGFSRKQDFILYKTGNKGLYPSRLFAVTGKNMVYSMYIKDIFPDYYEKLEVDRRDYSPVDGVIHIDFKDGQPCRMLKKEQTHKIFEAKVYSDFVGLSNEDPNGLVQTEISKRINLLPQLFIFKVASQGRWTMGLLGYIEPSVTLSKIEKNNRYLELKVKDRIVNNQYAPLKYASTLDLRQFQNFSAGFDLNILTIDLPTLKSTFYFDYGFRYGRTAIRDSIRTFSNGVIVREKFSEDFGVNTLSHHPLSVKWKIRSDERYSFIFSYTHNWFFLRDTRFTQVASNEDYDQSGVNPPNVRNEYTTIGMLATLKPSSDKGKLFFRYLFNWQQGYWKTGFHQAQVGYSFFILGRN